MPRTLAITKEQFTGYMGAVARDVGILLHVPGVMAGVTLPICLLLGEYYAIWPFTLTAIVSLGIGQFLSRLFHKSERSQLRHAMITVALSWGFIPILGAIPLLLIAHHLNAVSTVPLTIQVFQNPWNSLFETFSGFTSTGLSMALRPSELPKILQWWRSFMEWIGGVGVIVLMISVLEPTTDPQQLYSAEGRQTLIGLTLKETVRRIWWIYLLYTVLSVIWFRIVGMPWWEALNHGMTGISTGGFSVKDDSIGAYSPLIQWAVIPVMVLGAISFLTHYRLLKGRRLNALWEDTQHRALWILLGVGFIALLLQHYGFRGQFIWLDAAFQWTSALGTCGFSTADIQTWSAASKLMLSVAMIFGGAAGSTVGGLKLNRVSALFLGILWRFQRIGLQPHQMMRYEFDNEIIPEAEANRRIEAAAVLAVLWISLITIGVIILLQVVPSRYGAEDVIVEAASALGSVGLSIGIVHPDLAEAGKAILILFMWMGRLEIIPVLLLISLPFSVLKTVIRTRIHR